MYVRPGLKIGEPGYGAFGAHVDDMFCIGDDAGHDKIDEKLAKTFKVKTDYDPAVLTGVQLEYDKELGYGKLHMAGYIEQMLEKCGMTDCNPQAIPLDPGIAKGAVPALGETPADGWDICWLFQCLLGMLLLPAIKCRPDIMFAVCFRGRFASTAGKIQILWAKGVIRYPAGTKTWGLGYQRHDAPVFLQAAGFRRRLRRGQQDFQIDFRAGSGLRASV